MKRRKFLKLGAASLGGAAAAGTTWTALIEKALALPPHNPSGTPNLADIEHVVIFMQENRSFDHYFGTYPGVRGYGDPRPAPIPSGNTVWYQPEGTNPGSRSFSQNVPVSAWTSPDQWYETNRAIQSSQFVLPFRLNRDGNVAFQYLTDLNHSWKQSQNTWGNWDGWVPLKSRQSMGFLNATDLPFYHPLAAAFTVCDDYHCSVFAATDPNRFYLWSGTCPPPMNFPDAYTTGGYVADITHDDNSHITPAMYGQSAEARQTAVAAGVADWKTYAETLTDARVTWKVYQEYDNYGDNYLQYFKNFRIDNEGVPISQSQDPYFQTLYLRGRRFAPQVAVIGDAVIAEFAKDAAAGAEPDNPELAQVKPGLPRVSWIVAPYVCCEHPSASPGDGEAFTAKLLNVLVNEHPEVFRKTAFFLMYDENDGYFDHVPSPIPAISAEYGAMTLVQAGSAEDMSSIPVGLGPRVPMMVISPWSRGGKVSSQLLDHTSTLRFLEKWLPAKQVATADSVQCTLISEWRRAVCGDLTQVFDFANAGSSAPIDTQTHFFNGTELAAVPAPQSFPALPAVVSRSMRPTGVEAVVHGHIDDKGQLVLSLANRGILGTVFKAYWTPMTDTQSSFQYTVEAGKALIATPVTVGPGGAYDCAVYGPNGYLREFRGSNASALAAVKPEVMLRNTFTDAFMVVLLNNREGKKACLFQISDNAYYQNRALEILVPGGAEMPIPWATSGGVAHAGRGCSGWYDFSVRVAGDATYLRRLAGCVEEGEEAGATDPANANPALFKPSLGVHEYDAASQRIDYVTPPWHHRPRNWVGVFSAGTSPATGAALQRVYAPRDLGSVLLSITSLKAGTYELWYLFDDGNTPLAGPVKLTVPPHGHGS
jgi:phospholipase C